MDGVIELSNCGHGSVLARKLDHIFLKSHVGLVKIEMIIFLVNVRSSRRPFEVRREWTRD